MSDTMNNVDELVTGSVSFSNDPTPPALAFVPALTKRQLRLGLLDLGVTVQQVSDIIDQMPEPARSKARIEWEDSTSYLRTHPLVGQIGAALNIDTPTLDAAWAAAASL